MAEYIEKELAIAKLTNLEVTNPFATLTDAKWELANMSNVNVAPIIHAKWEIVIGSNGREYMVCTRCRKQQTLTGVFSYCPNCGAKTEEVERTTAAIPRALDNG